MHIDVIQTRDASCTKNIVVLIFKSSDHIFLVVIVKGYSMYITHRDGADVKQKR